MGRFKNIIYAGTFDHLHIGHKKMLERAFSISEHVSLFITSDEMVRKKLLSQIIETLDVRRKMIEEYLKEKQWVQKSHIHILHDIYGSSNKNNSFDAILVTPATKPNAVKVNKVRRSKSLKELEIIVEPMVQADDGKPVTSERIRMGEIDREGHNYMQGLSGKGKGLRKKLTLPEHFREELRKPLGKVFGGSVDQLSETARQVIKFIKFLKFVKIPMIIAVGDIVTMSLMNIGFEPDVKIIDLKSRRQRISNFQETRYKQISNLNDEIYQTINDPGTINLQAGKAIQKSYKEFLFTGKKQLIVVKGEEDLLALPAILLAPLHSVVLYGQWNLGVVIVEVTEQKKKEIQELIQKFR